MTPSRSQNLFFVLGPCVKYSNLRSGQFTIEGDQYGHWTPHLPLQPLHPRHLYVDVWRVRASRLHASPRLTVSPQVLPTASELDIRPFEIQSPLFPTISFPLGIYYGITKFQSPD